jgi:DNA-binding NarL/FixJ family response regulator
MAEAELIDRSSELARIEALLATPADGFVALELAGAAGIGKTSLWARTRRMAEARGFAVLWSRPTETAAKSSFGAVADLLFPVGSELLDGLPRPQREALEVALLRRPNPRRGALHQAVASGLLGVIRELAEAAPLVLAVDDWQWLDRPSRDALMFVAHRLEREPVRIVYSLRTPAASGGLANAVTDERFTRIALAGLGLSGIARLVSDRLGRSLPRPLLVRISQSTAGNPFHVLELAQALVENGASVAPGAALPVPENLRELLLTRVTRLPRATREALALVAALSQPSTRFVDAPALTPAEDAGIIAVEPTGLVRFSHPLLAATVQGALTTADRRRVHRRAAQLIDDPEQRARHLALAASGADPDVAHNLDGAAALAELRGAPDTAAELSELAAELTPSAAGQRRAERLVRAGALLLFVGDLERADRLLREALELPAEDALRARALQVAAQLAGRRNNWPAAAELATTALALAEGHPALLAAIECDLAFASVSIGVFPDALAHGLVAVRYAAMVGDDGIEAVALAVLTMVTFLGGGGVERGQLDRALQLEDSSRADGLMMRPSFIAALLDLWTGNVKSAAATLTAIHDELLERGQDGIAPLASPFISWAHLWQGDFTAAGRAAEQAEDAAALLGDQAVLATARTASALVHAHRGQTERARLEAQQALTLYSGLRWASALVWPSWALGLAALCEDDHELVHSLLGPLAEQVSAMGAGDPIVGVFAPDEIQALIALGHEDQARDLLVWFGGRADALGATWALALSARCRALLAARGGDIDAASAAFQAALAAHDRSPIQFERARTLLLAGRCYRRAKRRRAAVEALSEAAELFARLGASGWADRARAELSRVGHRAAGADSLTASERLIAELAASGLTNREVADRAFVSVKTVEANLTRIYRKLGIRSRVGLANTLQA